MLLQLKSIQNKRTKRFLEHSIYIAILFLLIPAFLYFELCIVLPAVETQWSFRFFIHILCVSFLLMNIIGNMIYGMFTNTSIMGVNLIGHVNEDTWTFCEICMGFRPPRAWHCNTCDVCILKRDHHCTFFACCVGYNNHRYFMFFTMYIFIGMVYGLYYNIQFLLTFITWNHGLVLMKFVFPLASFVLDFNAESIYVFLVVINVIVGLFTGFLFFYHFNNILKGRVVPETSNDKKCLYDKGWKLNMIEVFGSRWYLTWISPFIESKLPGIGIEYGIEGKDE